MLLAVVLPLNLAFGLVGLVSDSSTRWIALGVVLLPTTVVCWWAFARMRSVPFVVDGRTFTRRTWPRRTIEWRTVTDVTLYTNLLSPSAQRLVIVYQPDGGRQRYLACYPWFLTPDPEDLLEFLLRRLRRARA